MKKRWLAIMIAVIAILSILLPYSLAANTKSTSDNTVSLEDAQKAATYFVEYFSKTVMPDWVNTTISSPVYYYSSDMTTRSAYEFTVFNNKPVGFIIISANKDWMPVLEFGGGKSPSNCLTDAIQIAVEKGYLNESDKIEPNIYYFGALSYSFQLGEKMKRENKVVDIINRTIKQIPQEQSELKMDKSKARASWEKINKDDFGHFSLLTVEEDSISGVPAYWQSWGVHDECDEGYDESASYPSCVGMDNDPWGNWDSCAPISGAMVLGYWRTHGYPDIAYDFPTSEKDECLIDHCHAYMFTTPGGTEADDIVNVVGVAWDYGYENFSSSNILNPSWSEVKAEVNANQPSIFTMWGNPEYSPALTAHSVCYFGYYADDWTGYITIHDTFDTSEHYVTWNDWSDANLTWVSD